MKIVYDNIIFSLQKAGGISMYWAELIKRLSPKLVLYGKKNNNIFYQSLSLDEESESVFPISIIRYLPFQKKLNSGDVFHSSYYRVSLSKGVKNIVTVHDFIYEKHGSGLSKVIHLWQKGYALKKADGIICISENTKKDLLVYYPKLDQRKITVIYHGVSDAFKQLEKKDGSIKSGNRSILFVGSRASYKNFDMAVMAVSKTNHNLTIVGSPLKKEEVELLNKYLDGRYFFLGNISDIELNVVYNNTFAFVYPTSYEGFGLPILEAMKAGCPVIASMNSSIPEVSGSAAILIDKCNEDRLADAIDSLSEEARQGLIEKGLENASRFNWDKCAKETLDFYTKV